MTRIEFDEQYAKGLNLLLHGEFSEASKIFLSLEEAAHGNPDVPYALALCLLMLNRRADALACCAQISAMHNDPRGEKLARAIAAFDGNTAPLLESLRDGFASVATQPAPRKRPWILGAAMAAVFLALIMVGVWKAALAYTQWQMRSGPVLRMPLAGQAAFGTPLEPPAPLEEKSTPPAGAFSGDSCPVHPGGPDTVPEQPLPPMIEGPVDSIVDLQPYRIVTSLTNAAGDWVRLTDLNPRVGAWHLLEMHFQGQDRRMHLETYSLDNVFGAKPKLSLYSDGLAVIDEGAIQYYPLWGQSAAPGIDGNALVAAPAYTEALQAAATADSSLSLLCGDYVLLRTQRPGSSTEMEFAVDVFRRYRMGDWFVEKMKPWLIKAPESAHDDDRGAAPETRAPIVGYPQDALIDPARQDLTHDPRSLGIALDNPGEDMVYGRWYPARNHRGVYAALMIGSAIDLRILESYADRVSQMGPADRQSPESNNLVYLLAFDLEQFAFGYCLGADHPRVDWSARAQGFDKTRGGPDGFGTKSPLATVGIVPPYLERAAAAVFAGGFKREHGAFMYGEFSRVNQGSHFGFVEQGVIFSRLQPGLATFEIDPAGRVHLLTWPEDGAARFPDILHARQNGVPLIDGIDAEGISIPGALVSQRGAGSWSGNVKGEQMTIRSGVALQEMPDGRRFLMLAYFTGATPKSMARVFQAFQCRYAMGLDMNSLALCYTALYQRDAHGNVTHTEYLLKDMASANAANGALRFLQNNDARDFFYVLRRG